MVLSAKYGRTQRQAMGWCQPPGTHVPKQCIAQNGRRGPVGRTVKVTNAIKDTVSVLYWYEELSSSWKFLEWFFGTFFCRRFAWGVGAPHARTLSATRKRGFFHWARCARKLTQSRLCPLQCKAGFVPRASGSAVRGVRGVRGVRQIVCVTGVWHFSLRLWPKPAEAAHSAPLTTRMPRPLGASPCTAEYVHTWLKAPYPVRFVKLSNHRLS